MSVKVMGWVWDQDLPQNEKFVLLAYADHADHNGHNIFPSVNLIAHKTGYTDRSVQRIVKKLKAKGFLFPDGVGPSGTNRYSIPVPVGGDKMTPPLVVDSEISKGGDTSVRGGVTPVSPEPSVNRHDESKEPPNPPRAGKRSPLTADDIMMAVAIPDKFTNLEFMSAWSSFLEHRIEIKKPMTTRGAVMMIKKLGKYSSEVAVTSFQDSVANGWQGVFPVKGNDMPSRQQSRSSQAREDMDNYLRRDLEKNLMDNVIPTGDIHG